MTSSQPHPSGPPGLRALRSPRFRTVLALALAVYGIALNAYLLDVLSYRQVWFEDYAAYVGAAQRLLDGSLAFTPDQLTAPIPAVCPGCYLYPPALAQLMTPLEWLTPGAAEVVWFALLTVAGLAAVWIAGTIGGAARSLERGLWTVVAVALFMPMFQSNWLGNVSTFAALGVTLTAYGGAIAGMAVAVGVLIKVVAGAFVPAVFVADRSSRLSFVGTLAGLGLILFAFAPDSWLEYPTVLANLNAGPADVHWNLAPAVVAEQAGLGDGLVGVIRAGTIVVAVIALGLSVWLARIPGGMPAAVVAATVTMLLLPGSLWYHYLTVLLPFTAMAWPSASSRVRVTFVIALAGVSVAGLIFTPLVILAGSAVVLVLSGWVLWGVARHRPPQSYGYADQR